MKRVYRENKQAFIQFTAKYNLMQYHNIVNINLLFHVPNIDRGVNIHMHTVLSGSLWSDSR
jgi:hypothetical protein